MRRSDVTLAVLAGGRGTRMGRPKSTLTLWGRPILAALLDRLAWPGPTLLVTSPGTERPPAHDRFDAEATDPLAGEGPLRGVLTALEHAPGEVVAITTVDMPAVMREQLDYLVDHLPALAVMCSHSDAAAGEARIEPFPCAFRTRARDVVAKRLATGARSVYALRDEGGVTLLPAPPDWPARVWTNLNRPEDLKAFEGSPDDPA